MLFEYFASFHGHGPDLAALDDLLRMAGVNHCLGVAKYDINDRFLFMRS